MRCFIVMHRTIRLLATTFLACGLLLTSSASVGAGSSSSPRSPQQTRARVSTSVQVGVGDEQTEMFRDRLWQPLHTRIVRYILPYDASVRGYSLKQATAWIRAAERQHQQVLVAFYHSLYTPTWMPSIASYQ